MNEPKYIFVHHTGGTEADPLADTSHHTFEDVDAWHRQDQNIWLGHFSSLGHAIGYHYFIDKTGKVTQGRAHTDEGAHTRGFNTQSLGICLAGNFDVTFPTLAQVDALRVLLRSLKTQYDVPILPHRARAAKTCYGKNLSDSWAADLLNTVTTTPCTAEHAEISMWKKAYFMIDNILTQYFRR